MTPQRGSDRPPEADIARMASRLLTLMGEQVRGAGRVGMLELFLMWSDHLTIEQFGKALGYLMVMGLVGLQRGDVLVWTGPTAPARSASLPSRELL